MAEASKVVQVSRALVSVVVPARNAEGSIRRLLLSVLGQSYDNLEIVLVDDASKDSTALVAREMNDGRVVVVSGGGKGVSHARNVGISASSGKYVMFADADDQLEADAISKAVDLIEKSGSDMVIGGVRKVWFDSRQADYVIDAERPISYCGANIAAIQEATIGYSSASDSRLDSCLLTGCWGRLIRRCKLKGCQFDESLSIGEDTVFNIEVLNICDSVIVAPDIWYLYYQNQGSAVNGYRLDAFDEGASLMEVLNAKAGSELRNAVMRRSLFQLEGACRQRIAHGCPETSFFSKARAIQKELGQGYWSCFLSERTWVSRIGMKHRLFLFLARRKMTRILCLVIALTSR